MSDTSDRRIETRSNPPVNNETILLKNKNLSIGNSNFKLQITSIFKPENSQRIVLIPA
jgi:hypothetical protein